MLVSLFPPCLTYCLTSPLSLPWWGWKSKSGTRNRITLEVRMSPDRWHAWNLEPVTLWSVNSAEIKGCRSSGCREEKEGKAWALSGGNYKCLGVCRSCENTGTSSPVTAVPPRISEDSSHVRHRCTVCVWLCVCLCVTVCVWLCVQ